MWEVCAKFYERQDEQMSVSAEAATPKMHPDSDGLEPSTKAYAPALEVAFHKGAKAFIVKRSLRSSWSLPGWCIVEDYNIA